MFTHRALVASAVALCAVADRSAAQSPGSADSAARQVYTAIATADTVTLRALLSPDLRWVSANSGTVATRPQLLRAASRLAPDLRLEYRMDSVETLERGGMAIVDYVLTNRRTFRDYQTAFIARASDTFAREDGRWRLVRHVQSWLVHPPDTTTMDSLRLAPFVGRYDRGHGYIDDVHFHDGHLVAQSTYEALVSAPGAHLYPVSRDTFSPERSAPMIVFERDARGQVTGYVQRQPDGTIARAPRLGGSASTPPAR